MKYLRCFETTQEQESKIGNIDYNAILFNNETGIVTILKNDGSDTYTLRFTYNMNGGDGQYRTYFYATSTNVPILEVNPIVKIDGEVVTPDPAHPSLTTNQNDHNATYVTPGEHTVDFIINKAFKTIPSNSFSNCEFTSVIIPDDINEIGSYAFAGDEEVAGISIPSSVTTIGPDAFFNVKYIEYYGSATWGSGSRYWGAVAMNLEDAYTLRFTYNMNDGQDRAYFYESSSQAPILEVNPIVKIDGEIVTADPNYPILTTDPNHSGTYVTQGEHTIDFIINKQYSTIPDNSFNACYYTNVIIPDDINEIGNYAFSDAYEAEDISIPSSVTIIGEGAFENVKHIEYYGSATWEDGNQYWGAEAMNSFNNEGSNNDGSDTYTLRFTYDMSDNVNRAYFYVASADAPILELNPVVKIDGEVVTPNPNYECLTTNQDDHNSMYVTPGEHTVDFIINKQYSTIPDSSFSNCGFTSVIIPDDINEIGGYAFAGADEAEEISIPSSVTTIGDYAFESIPHITYHGSATGQPWGALSMN